MFTKTTDHVILLLLSQMGQVITCDCFAAEFALCSLQVLRILLQQTLVLTL